MTREPEPDTDEDPATRAEVRAVAGVDVRADAIAVVDPLSLSVDPLSVDPREARARAAYRAARDAGAHRSLRTRRRDDWRPARVRRRWHGGHRP
ncbi:hypothetical protein ACF06X_16050 [Streptomyces sp. NPDC015346]|uniref:hypothetical protein n=1 Tax=Streptomyces sp. NPDC015346 TaxID=3364954 RepID=UPI0036F6AA87